MVYHFPWIATVIVRYLPWHYTICTYALVTLHAPLSKVLFTEIYTGYTVYSTLHTRDKSQHTLQAHNSSAMAKEQHVCYHSLNTLNITNVINRGSMIDRYGMLA